MLAHKADNGIAAAEYIHSEHGRVNYGTSPSVVYTHQEVVWVRKTEQELNKACNFKGRKTFASLALAIASHRQLASPSAQYDVIVISGGMSVGL